MHTRSRTSIWLLALALLLLVISPCSVFFPQPTPTLMPGTPTETPVIKFTATPNSSPTSSVTPSPYPTKPSTPQPGWVTEFAQPILDVIADRPPSFQDDFGAGSAGWKEAYCTGTMEYIEGELILTNCRIYHTNIDWRDFVLEFDIHYMEGTTPSSYFVFAFRDLGSEGHQMTIYPNGDVLIGFANRTGESDSTWFRGSAHPANQTNHILLIAKENRFAFYLNDQPLFSTENNRYPFGRSVYYAENPGPNAQAILAMDNFRIWDISDIPIP